MNATELFLVVALIWAATGLVTSYVMRRRGHAMFSWGVLGAVFGPLVIPLALDSVRRARQAGVRAVAAGVAGHGTVDVLVAIDGSSESIEALEAAVRLLGPRIRRLTLAAVIDFEAATTDRPWGVREGAEAELRRLAEKVSGPRPELVCLAGRPAEALAKHAVEGRYDLIAAGKRGRGLSKAILGSVASQLARAAGVPVLLAGR
jgi:nucleotide-binding universal stress UspA family protein